MKKAGLYFLLIPFGFGLLSGACNHPIIPNAPIIYVPAATPTAGFPTYVIPTTTPGCYSAISLPVTQYTVPNPMPTATPFWTPVVAVPTTTMVGYVDSGSYGAVILKSLPDWNTYWTDLGLPVPPAPTDFISMMVFVPGSYYLNQICYSNTEVTVDQDYVTPGTHIFTGLLTPIPTPSTVMKGFYLVPASSLPVSFNSTLTYGM